MPAHVGSATTRPVTCVIAKTKIRSKKSSSGVTRSSPLSRVRAGIEQAYPRVVGVPRAVRAGAWAALLSGAPSTLHALATGRDPLEAALAAGSILLPDETRKTPLLAAAVPVHL